MFEEYDSSLQGQGRLGYPPATVACRANSDASRTCVGACVTIGGVRLRGMTLDDLVSWGWSTALASTGIVCMYWVDVIAGAVLLMLGLLGMHVVRARIRHRIAAAHQSTSSVARSTTLASPSGDW